MAEEVPIKERETIINFGPGNGTVNVFTTDPTVKKKLTALGFETKPYGDVGVEADISKKDICIRGKHV